MKLVFGNGTKIEIREVSEPICTLETRKGNYLKFHGYEIMSDEKARGIIKEFKSLGKLKSHV
jgi:hypothetical protein